MTMIYRASAVLSLLFLLTGCDRCTSCNDEGEVVSDIKADETLVFFRTSGWFDDADGEWHLPVHGWIYEPQNSIARKEVVERLLQEQFDLAVTEQTRINFSRRVNLLIADNERGKKIVVNIAGRNHELPSSSGNGQFQETIVIPATDIAIHAENGFIPFSAVTADNESRKFEGAVRLLSPRGLSIISDIDDTVKITNVTDRRSLLEHTFLLDFAAAPGMAELYRSWSKDDMGIHYVSSSPWQLYEPLSEFLDASDYPWATFSLKTVRFRDETLLDLFRKGTETKPRAIEAILDRYPERQFVLVGDSGEQDPEVYAAMLRNRPDQVMKVFIRNVSQEDSDNPRFSTVFDGIDAGRWQLFEEPESLGPVVFLR